MNLRLLVFNLRLICETDFILVKLVLITHCEYVL